MAKKWSHFSYLNHPEYQQCTLSTALYVTPPTRALEEHKIPLNCSKYVIYFKKTLILLYRIFYVDSFWECDTDWIELQAQKQLRAGTFEIITAVLLKIQGVGDVDAASTCQELRTFRRIEFSQIFRVNQSPIALRTTWAKRLRRCDPPTPL